MPEVVSPGRSSRCPAEVSRDSSISTGASRSAARPAGTLMKKIQFQFACSVSSPPASGPIDSASEETPADADRCSALAQREGGGDDRQRRGVHQRGAEALHDAAADENGAARRKPAGERGAGENGEP